MPHYCGSSHFFLNRVIDIQALVSHAEYARYKREGPQEGKQPQWAAATPTGRILT